MDYLSPDLVQTNELNQMCTDADGMIMRVTVIIVAAIVMHHHRHYHHFCYNKDRAITITSRMAIISDITIIIIISSSSTSSTSSIFIIIVTILIIYKLTVPWPADKTFSWTDMPTLGQLLAMSYCVSCAFCTYWLGIWHIRLNNLVSHNHPMGVMLSAGLFKFAWIHLQTKTHIQLFRTVSYEVTHSWSQIWYCPIHSPINSHLLTWNTTLKLHNHYSPQGQQKQCPMPRLYIATSISQWAAAFIEFSPCITSPLQCEQHPS